jgi:hypothetical protein
MNNANRFNRCYSCRLASFSIIFGSSVWLLGNFISPALAVQRITGAEAVARISSVLGSPENFEADMKNSTQDFISDHFGSMAIAAAFSIAIRMRT